MHFQRVTDRFISGLISSRCTITDEELEHLELMVNAVLMENIIDAFEVEI
jgi:hypothetical protein